MIHARSRQVDRESGVAIVLSLIFIIIVSGLVTTGAVLMQSSQSLTEVQFRREGQANQFARSGLTEALNWFRRQSSQPVTTFSPVLNTAANPPIMDTDDPVIGLVREFEINGNIWGRYEVWKTDDSDPDPERLAWRQKFQVKDCSKEHGFSGAGNVWLVRSLGYVFQRRDPNVGFDVPPNRVLANVMLECEIQRLSLQPPGQSALSVRDGNNAHINTNGRIRGGAIGAGILYPTGAGTPTTGPANQQRVTGSPPLSATASYDDSPKAVFGVTLEELRSMANTVITNAGDFPNPVPQFGIVFAEFASITFDSSRPLMGTGVVYIKGNVSLIAGNNSNFSGLLYIDGALNMRAPSEINGAVICTGNMTLQGVGDYATITYDDEILSALRAEVGQYRWSGAIREILNRE